VLTLSLCALVRFETRRLPSSHGDYEWVVVDGTREVALPLIVERKSANDVSASIKDGRWNRQCQAMEARLYIYIYICACIYVYIYIYIYIKT